jgi:fatty acid desaturase
MASERFVEPKRLKELQQLKPWKTVAVIAFDWVIIGLSIAASQAVGTWWAWLIAAFVIAGRMHALASIVHEVAHYRLHRNKVLNDWIGDIFVAWPLLLTINSYRQNHLMHHQHANTELDPDYMVKFNQGRFIFPRKFFGFLSSLAGYLVGYHGYQDMRTGLNRLNRKLSHSKTYIALRISFYVIVLSSIIFAGYAYEFLIYWLIPYPTIFFGIMYIRSVAEHFAIENIDEKLEGTRTVIPHFWERAFFGPHNVSYHLEHHIYAGVPFYNLPALHKEMMKHPQFAAKAHITYGYTTGLIREILSHAGRQNMSMVPAATKHLYSSGNAAE